MTPSTSGPVRNGGIAPSERLCCSQIIGKTQEAAIQPIVPQTRTFGNSAPASRRCAKAIEFDSARVGMKTTE